MSNSIRKFITVIESVLSPDDFWDDTNGLSDQREAFIQQFNGMVFNTPEEARRAILDKLGPGALGLPDKNLERLANAAPIYFDGKGYRIGTKHSQPLITWNEIKLRSVDTAYLHSVAEANADSYDVHTKANFFSISDLLPDRDQDHYWQVPSERNKIEALAQAILENHWFEPIIVGKDDETGELWIIEGQHRARALAWHLKQSRVPAYLIEIYD